MIDRKSFIKFLAGVVITFCLIFLLIKMKEMLMLILLSSILAYILNPIVDFLENRKLPRIMAVLIVVFGMMLFVFLLLYFFFPYDLVKRVRTLVSKGAAFDLKDMYTSTITARDQFTRYPVVKDVIHFVDKTPWLKELIENVKTALTRWFSDIGKNVFATGKDFFGNIIYFVLFPIVSIFMMKDGKKLVVFIDAFMDNRRGSAYARFKENANQIFGNYFRGILLLYIIEMTFLAICLTALGIPGALLIGMASAFGLFVPYLGLVVGFLPSIALALYLPNPILKVVLVMIIFSAIQAAEVVLQPKIIGDRLGLHPLVILVAIIVGIKIFGLLGVFFSVPTAAFIVLFLQTYSGNIRKLIS